MTREELDAYLAERERSLGLPAGEFRSIWKQESGGSIDPALKGQELSRGRGAAVGPFQVVPYYHPDFPTSGSIKDQADFATNLYARGGMTLEDRAGAYYGRGTAPKGHPTTAQYAQQVRSRMPQAIDATPKENVMPEMPMLQNDEEQKRREYMAYVERMAQMRQQQQQQAPEFAEQPPQREMNMYEKMMTNPLTQMGAAIMAASGTDWGRPLGMGVMAANNAVHNRQQAENELWELQQKRKESQARAKLAERKLQQDEMGVEETNRMADYYTAKGEPEKAMQIRSGLLKTINPASYGTTPHYERDPKTGAVNVVRYSSDGTKNVEPAQGTPFSVESKLPEFQGQVAESKAAGEQGIKTLGGLYDGASAAASGLKAVRDMRTLMDQGIYTGRGDEVARNAAGWYSWATGKELPKLAATEQSRLLVQDIVLPALSNMKGASSDRDVAMLKEYAQGTGMTETALRGALERAEAKYGAEIDRYNKAHSQYTDGGKRSIVGFDQMEKPTGYIKRQEPAAQAKGGLTPAEQAELADLRKRLGR